MIHNSGKGLTTDNEIDEVKVYDMQGTLKIQRKFNKLKSTTINVSDLKRGTYVIEIINGEYKEKQQLIIQK